MRLSSTAPFIALALVIGGLTGCVTAPVRAVPDPLPETLDWVRASRGEAAFLGLEVRENDSGSLEDLFFAPGARVVDVDAGSPAEAAGFEIGDVLLSWDGERVDDPGALRALLEAHDGASEVTLEVQRGDSAFEVRVTPRPPAAGAAPAELLWRSDPARSLANWHTGSGGVVLVAAHEASPFVAADVPVGATVSAIDGAPMRSARGLIRHLQALAPGTPVEVTWRARDGEERTTQVPLYAPPTRLLSATVPILIGYTAEADGSEATFYLVDLWLISLFKIRREGSETHYSFLRFFTFATGVGELGE